MYGAGRAIAPFITSYGFREVFILLRSFLHGFRNARSSVSCGFRRLFLLLARLLSGLIRRSGRVTRHAYARERARFRFSGRPIPDHGKGNISIWYADIPKRVDIRVCLLVR